MMKVVLNESLEALEKMKNLSENWDGYGSFKPDALSIKCAKDFLLELYGFCVHMNKLFLVPNITADENGNICLEWWANKKINGFRRKITIYARPINIIYIKSPSDKISEMEDGYIWELNEDMYNKLFGWLNDESN